MPTRPDSLKVLAQSAVFCIASLSVVAGAHIAHADVPVAARLLSIPYNDTTSGGLRIQVNNLGSLRGITNDGTTIYLLNSNGNIVTQPMSALTGSPGGTVTVDGTSHSVGWGVGGIPAFAHPDGRALAYSHGCLFITDDYSGGPNTTINLYCIDVSDWSVTQIAVPGDEPLPAGHDWGRGTVIDFSDGRIGKVSKYAAAISPDTGYTSYLRMYTVTGTGKNATIAWSKDYLTHDTENWNTDEHGVATDGTYLYRIEFIGSHLSSGDFKSWPLSQDSTPDPLYAGLYTVPNDGGDYNVTFLSHDHKGSRYIIGGYGSNKFYITSAADPGPGPGHALVPAFDTLNPTGDGFTTQITNYDASFAWATSTTAGIASLNNTGLLTVTGLSVGDTATVTISTTKTDVPDGSASVTGTVPDVTPPVLSDIATSSVMATTTSISWSTDELASTKVVYSADASFASSTTEDDISPRTLGHSELLTNLLACTLYSFEVVSADASENYATSTSNSFITSGCLGGSAPDSATTTAVGVAATSTLSAIDSGRGLTVSTPSNFTATSSSIVIQIKGLVSGAVFAEVGKPSDSLNSAASIVFDVKALIDNSTLLDSFDLPVTITFQYTDADVAGLDTSTLAMYHYHDGAWIKLDGCVVDTDAKTVTCTTPSFSTFALFGSPATHTVPSLGTSSEHSGTSIPNQVANLLAMGNSTAAQSLMEKWPNLFPMGVSSSTPETFLRNLQMGMTGDDVRALQKILNAKGFLIAKSGSGSPGNETNHFGSHTRSALILFQKSKNISPALGYFGFRTRAIVSI